MDNIISFVQLLHDYIYTEIVMPIIQNFIWGSVSGHTTTYFVDYVNDIDFFISSFLTITIIALIVFGFLYLIYKLIMFIVRSFLNGAN